MYFSVDSFRRCFAALNIDLLLQKRWSCASSDVFYSSPSRSFTFNVSNMFRVSWPTISSNKALWQASPVTADARMEYWKFFFHFVHRWQREFWGSPKLLYKVILQLSYYLFANVVSEGDNNVPRYHACIHILFTWSEDLD